MTLTFRRFILTGMVLLCIMPVSACGKKPAHVDPPETPQQDHTNGNAQGDAGWDQAGGFPHVYPDPATNK